MGVTHATVQLDTPTTASKGCRVPVSGSIHGITSMAFVSVNTSSTSAPSLSQLLTVDVIIVKF